jgi:hypothetical protein
VTEEVVMIFSLEALKAKHGDSLLLHYGKPAKPRLIVIDGGPGGVYNGSLRPRLEEIKGERSLDAPLPIRMLMVSHLDDDHINGVLALTNQLVELMQGGGELPYDIVTLWHNSFDDIMGNGAQELAASLASAVKPLATDGALPANLPLSRPSAAVVASVPQGRQLRDNARRLALSLNDPFTGLVAAPPKGKKVVNLGDGLKFTVLGPNEARLQELLIEWDAVIKKKGLAKNAEGRALAAAFLDESVFNLSSIVVLAEADGKRMLLTGDARGDDMVAGLKTAGLLKSGEIHVDLFKLPHHGSDRNVETDTFRQIKADHYVVSGDGKHGNPEIATLRMISEARGQDEYMIHLTNREERLEEFFAREKAKGKRYQVIFREQDALSVRVDLGD